jgi:hypothetical protein
MTEDKGKVELEKVKKNARIVGGVGLIVLLVGLVVLFMAIFTMFDKMIPDNEHITDQDLPVRDIKNATYTWTADEIKDMVDEKTGFLVMGGAIAAVGMGIFYSAAVIEPSSIKMHKIGCAGQGEKKYCPECGLKLSRLERD